MTLRNIAISLILIGLVGVFASTASAQRKRPEAFKDGVTPEQLEKNRELRTEARDLRESGEGGAAKDLLGEAGLRPPQPPKDGSGNLTPPPSLTEEQQVVVEEARELFESGDGDAAKELLNDAGVNPPPKPEEGRTPANLTEQQQEVLEDAQALRESGDNEAARELLEEADIKPAPREKREEKEGRYLDTLSDEDKDVLEAAKELRAAGDSEAAKALVEDAGIAPPQREKREGYVESLNDDQKAALDEAKVLLESGDKEAAQALLEESGVRPPNARPSPRADGNITEEQQDVLDEAKILYEAGDYETARELIEDAGIELKKERLRGELKSEARDAVASGDYDTWQEVASTTKLAENVEINEETFDALIEAQALRDQGDNAAAKQILKDAGFKFGLFKGLGSYLVK